MNANGSSVWKWLTAFFAGVILSGVPAFGLLISKPSAEKVEKLESEINSLQIQQARMSEQILSLQTYVTQLSIVPRGGQ